MKKKPNKMTGTVIAATSVGAAALALSMFAAYRTSVKNLIPTSVSETQQSYVFSASKPDVPVNNEVSGVPISPKPETSKPASSSADKPSDVEANKPVIVDVGNIMPVTGEISHPFSYGELVKSETLGVWKTHDGCDILCDLGTDVRSMSEGVVKEIKDDPLWGVYVIVEQKNGLDVQYCGLAKELRVKAGEEVKQGEIIGQTSDTCQCEILQEPHLHLAVKQSGEWVDPMKVIDS